MLQHCSAVNIQKRFADFETSCDFPSVQLRADNDYILILGVNLSSKFNIESIGFYWGEFHEKNPVSQH